jgi:hypothetical protein
MRKSMNFTFSLSFTESVVNFMDCMFDVSSNVMNSFSLTMGLVTTKVLVLGDLIWIKCECMGFAFAVSSHNLLVLFRRSVYLVVRTMLDTNTVSVKKS